VPVSPPLRYGEKKNKTSREGGVTKQHNEMMRGGELEEGHPTKGSAWRLEGAARPPTTPPSTTPPGHFAWRGCAPGIKPASSFRAHGEDGGGGQNSISVTSHGSKRPIRCRQEAEKCKVTVHFTSDSVSVSLAGSPSQFPASSEG